MSTWVDQELATVQLGDQRRHCRLRQMVSAMAKMPGSSIPAAFKSHAEATAAYRFLHAPGVVPGDIMDAVSQAVVARCAGRPLVLAIEDTTSFSFNHHPATSGMGPLSGQVSGFLMHSVLMATPDGVPLGVLDQTVWARDPDGPRTADLYQKRPFAEKESARWVTALQAVYQRLDPATRVLCVADREADIYELFAAPRPTNADLLIRNSNNRRLVGASSTYLWETLAAQPVAGELVLQLPRRAQEKPRTTRLSVRHCEVTLHPPAHRVGGEKLPPVPVAAVEARELDPPAGKKPIVWVLLTTLPVADLAAALQCVSYYSRRWLIERYHYTLKSGGCRFEDSQLQDYEALTRLLALQCLVAWRLLWLTYLSRTAVEQPCTVAFTDLEWRVLHLAVREIDPHFLRQSGYEASSNAPPSLHTAVRWLGKLGGFLGRKGDGEPGVKVLWGGLATLHNIVLGVMIAKNIDVCNA